MPIDTQQHLHKVELSYNSRHRSRDRSLEHARTAPVVNAVTKRTACKSRNIFGGLQAGIERMLAKSRSVSCRQDNGTAEVQIFCISSSVTTSTSRDSPSLHHMR
jgi:hypothetical protein